MVWDSGWVSIFPSYWNGHSFLILQCHLCYHQVFIQVCMFQDSLLPVPLVYSSLDLDLISQICPTKSWGIWDMYSPCLKFAPGDIYPLACLPRSIESPQIWGLPYSHGDWDHIVPHGCIAQSFSLGLTVRGCPQLWKDAQGSSLLGIAQHGYFFLCGERKTLGTWAL